VEGHKETTEEQMLEIHNFQEIMEAIPKCLNAFYPSNLIPALKWFDFQGLDRRFKETNKRMDAFATKIISEHQEQCQMGPVAEHEKDMVHILLDEMDQNGTDKSGPHISMANVKGVMWVRRSFQLISDCHLLLRCNSIKPAVHSLKQTFPVEENFVDWVLRLSLIPNPSSLNTQVSNSHRRQSLCQLYV